MEKFFQLKSSKDKSKDQTLPSKQTQRIKANDKIDNKDFLNVQQNIPKSQFYNLNEISNILKGNKFSSKSRINLEENSTIQKFMPLFLITDTFELVSQKSGQNSQDAKKQLISSLFKICIKQFPSEIESLYYFCLLKTDNDWIQKDLGIGHEILLKAVANATGRSATNIRTDFRNLGCLGIVLEQSKQSQNTLGGIFNTNQKQTKKTSKGFEKVTFQWVFENLKLIKEITGSNSTSYKEAIIVKLFIALSPLEAKYICRFLQGNYKIGVAEKFFQSAIGRAFCSHFMQNNFKIIEKSTSQFIQADEQDKQKISEQNKSELFSFFESVLQKIITQFPDYRQIIQNLKTQGSLSLVIDNCRLRPGTPCKPMLAKPTKSYSMIFSRLENLNFTCEFKYDGLRGQIHYSQNSHQLHIFSRNLEDMTDQYPDIALAVAKFTNDKIIINQIQQKHCLTNNETENLKNQDLQNPQEKIESFILDSEIVAFDTQKNKILPFQVLATRGRKNVKIQEQQITVYIFAFDLLYFNGQSLLEKNYQDRRTILKNLIQNYKNQNPQSIIQTANNRDCNSVEEIEQYLEESVKNGCEGLMVKTLSQNSTYEPSKRTFKWLKVKKDYIENRGLGDSFDLVVVGANYGKGKRTGYYGNFLMASYNPELEVYETCTLVGSGLSDKDLEEFYGRLKGLELNEKPNNIIIDKQGYSEVWFEPFIVWEIKAADIQVSPIYKCCKDFLNLQGNEGKGLGLRFPRFLRERKDKKPGEASSSKFIYQIYKQQAQIEESSEEDNDYY